jgi:hypothetical protein
MSRIRTGWIIAAVLAGFVGGAAAQERFWPWPKAVTAQAFVVMDEHSKKRAELGISGRDGKLVLRLYDESGRVIWSAPPKTEMLPLAVR